MRPWVVGGHGLLYGCSAQGEPASISESGAATGAAERLELLTKHGFEQEPATPAGHMYASSTYSNSEDKFHEDVESATAERQEKQHEQQQRPINSLADPKQR